MPDLTVEIVDEATVAANASSLDFLQAVYRCADLPLATRLRAAVAALPFEHPRLSVIANISNANLGDRLERAIARSSESPGFRPPLIEAKVQAGDGAEPTGEPGFKRRF